MIKVMGLALAIVCCSSTAHAADVNGWVMWEQTDTIQNCDMQERGEKVKPCSLAPTFPPTHWEIRESFGTIEACKADIRERLKHYHFLAGEVFVNGQWVASRASSRLLFNYNVNDKEASWVYTQRYGNDRLVTSETHRLLCLPGALDPRQPRAAR